MASNIASLQSLVEHIVAHLNLHPASMSSPLPNRMGTSVEFAFSILPSTFEDCAVSQLLYAPRESLDLHVAFATTTMEHDDLARHMYLDVCYHRSCSCPERWIHYWMAEGTCNQSATYENLNPQKMDGCHVGYGFLHFMPLNARVTKGETQSYPERTDLQPITRSSPKSEYVR